MAATTLHSGAAPLSRDFLTFLSSAIEPLGFPAIDIDRVMEDDGDLLERHEDKGIVTCLVLFPTFAQINYCFAGETRPGPRFHYPDPGQAPEAVLDQALDIASHLMTQAQAEERDPALKRMRLAGL